MLKKFLAEFRDFAERGNAIDMAVGVITGAALNGLVNSLVKDILTPPIGLLLGGMDFSALKIPLWNNAAIGIGGFINASIAFVITLFAIFLFVRIVNKMKAKQVETTRVCPYCKIENVSVDATKCPACCSTLTPIKHKRINTESDAMRTLEKAERFLVKRVKKIGKK